MAPTTSISDSDSRVYHTRFRKCIQKKYDDIFSSVVQKALSKDPNLINNNLSCRIAEGHRRKANSISCSGTQSFVLKQRSISESEPRSCEVSSLGSESSLDSDSCESISDVASNSPSREDELMVVEFEKKKNTFFPVFCCDKELSNHQNLHEHLVMQHSSTPMFSCQKCGVNLKALRNRHFCRICNQFAWSLDIHLRSHYQDRTGSGALMECRHCYRSFPTLREVREHEKRVHIQQKAKTVTWTCQYCRMQFESRHMRDTHLVGHVDQTVGDIWERVDKMQEIMTDQVLVNQCPLCLSVMGSRKSFRLHIIHKHLAQDPHSFLSFLGVPSQILASSAYGSKSVKQEITEEVDVKPYIEKAQVKSEPIE